MKKIVIVNIFILFTLKIYSQAFSVEGIRNEVFIPGDLLFTSTYHNNDNYKSDDYTFIADGATEHVLISTPKVVKPENGYPIIILIHGFIEPSHYSTFSSYKLIFNRFASSEFMVAKPDLRGHGRSELNQNYESSLSLVSYTRDILQLIASLKNIEYVDTENIFLMGHSNGGNQVIRVLTSKPNLIRAASLWGPTIVQQEESNLFWRGGAKRKYGDNALKLLEAKGDVLHQKELVNNALKKFGNETADSLNFLKFLQDIKTPFVIRHPDTDESVPYKWSVDFINEYNKSGNKTEYQFINYPGDNHNIASNQYTAQMADLNWFRKYIKK